MATPIGNLGDLSPRAASSLGGGRRRLLRGHPPHRDDAEAPRHQDRAARLPARRQRGQTDRPHPRRAERRPDRRRRERRRHARRSPIPASGSCAAAAEAGRTGDGRARPLGGDDGRRAVRPRRRKMALRGLDREEGQGAGGAVGGDRLLALPERLLRVAAADRGDPRRTRRRRAAPSAGWSCAASSRKLHEEVLHATASAKRRPISAPSRREASSSSSSTRAPAGGGDVPPATR